MFKSILASLFFVLPPLTSFAKPANPFAAIAQQASQSVVFVAIEINPFDQYYGPQPGDYAYLRPFYDYFWPSKHGHGSGFIISPDGYIVTNAHVVEDATKVLVVVRTDETLLCKASVLGKDVRTDVAVLKIEDPMESPLPFLKFGDSDQIQVGQQVICIGNPRSPRLESTVTSGIISGIDRNNFGIHSIEGYIQTDAAINPGNSGGPLLNTEGEVIGVSSWMYKHTLGFEGLSFAISSHTAQTIARQIITHGKISQGFLGVELDIDDEMESAFEFIQFDSNEGAYIIGIIEDSPAEKAGLRVDDIILKVDQYPVRSAASLRNRIAILEPKTSIQLLFERDGELLEVTLELGSEELANAHSDLIEPDIVI